MSDKKTEDRIKYEIQLQARRMGKQRILPPNLIEGKEEMSDKLAEWRLEAKGMAEILHYSINAQDQRRILALIDLVRKKDEALMNAIESTEEDRLPSLRRMYSAVLLTKDLK